MRARKLLDKLKGILSAEHQAQQKKYKSLKKILKALREEKDRLKKEIGHIRDEAEREHVEARLRVISMQRKKGLKLLKELKKERKKERKT
jgi:hypothetical protein